eukprot:TRINITY_DN6315_c0_g1_i1.p1 TRINITY_DN6315_c0_g1~~TRINITY_DN6315_c0_g1_i1.p1  ORF type:complete len:408 (-),score=56.90 TRINITY_DN6315_c0_g1_i1:51-1274(-)
MPTKLQLSWREFFRQLLYYHTAKVVQIRSKPLALLYYGIVALILFYVGFWAIYKNKGYQQFDQFVGDTSVKVKGNAYMNDSNGSITIWDAQDVVYPPKEANALFVTTNYQYTPLQTRSICTGDDNETESCSTGCPPLASTLNGVTNGTCNVTANYCYIYSWCPLEQWIPSGIPDNVLTGVDKFSVFIRFTVKSPHYGNVFDNANGTKVTHLWNQFYISDMLKAAGTSFKSVAADGAAFAVIAQFDCNLDWPYKNRQCVPELSFVRIDSSKESQLSSLAPGYNFRYSYHYYLPEGADPDNFQEYRDLYKVYGLRFIFLVGGKAGKFNVVPLFINIGSGLALLGVATVVADFISLYVLPGRKFYRTVKYETVDAPLRGVITNADSQENIPAPEKDKASEESPLLGTIKF